jgi:hypothetical protein
MFMFYASSMKNKRLELVVLLDSYYGAARKVETVQKYVLIFIIQSKYVHAC